MPNDGPRYQIGNVGQGAVVQQGKYLWNIAIYPKDDEAAKALVRFLEERRDRTYRSPLPRRLEPLVLLNRREQLAEIADYFEKATVNVLYVFGLVGIGKSVLVRGTLELLHAETLAIWVNCDGLDAETLLSQVNAGMHLEAGSLLRDTSVPLNAKIAAVLGAMRNRGILVLDGFEALLDERGRYRSKEMAVVMEALTTLEHNMKVLVTTRLLPHSVGEGASSVQILRLRGLSTERSEELFQERTQLTAEEMRAPRLADALEKLEGHPLFIELLASALAELPAQEVVAGLLIATDIGEYLTEKVLSPLDVMELQVLRAALVFRQAFTFEVLNVIYSALVDRTQTIVTPVRTLVRRALLEVVSEAKPLKYYLHPLLRDAVPREREQEAAAHAAAARCFLSGSFNASDLTTWDDGLYHLRRAAEVGRSEAYYESYRNFLFEKQSQLHHAGWGARLTQELSVLAELTTYLGDAVRVFLRWAKELMDSSREDDAQPILRRVIELLTEVYNESDLDERTRLGLGEWLALAKCLLGQVLLQLGNIEEAEKLAKEVETMSGQGYPVNKQYNYLRFAIAEARMDKKEMLAQAELILHVSLEELKNSLELSAEEFHDLLAGCNREIIVKGLINNAAEELHGLASACNRLAQVYLYLDEMDGFLSMLQMQLLIAAKTGSITSLAPTLFNLGELFMDTDPVGSGAAFLVAEQLRLEVGLVKEAKDSEKAEPIIQAFLSDHRNIEQGRKELAKISDMLLPYLERAMERRLQV